MPALIPRKIIARVHYLRKRGFSICEISRECGVPKSSVFRHIRNISISPRYLARFYERRNGSRALSEKHWEEAGSKASKLIQDLSAKEKALIAVALYWAEGNKKDFCLTNTDGLMIQAFICILREIFHVNNNDIRISLRIFEDLDPRKCIKYWSKITDIKLGKDTPINTLHGRKKGKLEFGMCRLRVRKGGLLLKEFSSIIKRMHHFSMTPP